MTTAEVAADCGTDVLVSFAESLRVSTGLLTVAAVCGGLTGMLAASLLYLFCLKPLLLTRQCYNARRLLESDVGNLDDNQSDGVNSSRKDASSGTTDGKLKKETPINSDVAAFASRAKVVYPINQKYRPLADGASNPSLLEHTKLTAMPDEESSSSADEEALSQKQDNIDSSQFISSVMVPKSLQNQSFTRVSHYPHTLTQRGSEGRMSLYCLALQDLQHHSSQLEEEKYLIFLQMVKMIFGCRFPKDKRDADFTKNIVLKQEQELTKLRKELPENQTMNETSPDTSCSLEDIERAQKDHFERSLQTSKSFSRQVEDLCHLLLKRSSVFSPDDSQDVVSSLIQTLLFVENHLLTLQEAELQRTLEKLLWWEDLSGLVQSQPALLRWEVNLRQSLIAATLEQLTSDNVLKFSHMEKIISEIQVGLSEGLHQSTEECVRKTKELVNEKCSKKESKKRKLQRSQLSEKNRALEQSETHGDLRELTTFYQELLMKHRKQIFDLELQQDNKIAATLCDLWKKLRSRWSKRLGETAKEIFVSSVPAQTGLTAEHCENLWLDVEQELAAQLQQAECTTKQQLEDMRTELNKDGQVWREEMALTQACLKHLAEQQMKILRAMVSRQSYTLNSPTGKLLERKHEHLLVLVQRSFVVRHFCLHMLKEMRLSKLKTLSQTDFRALLMEDAPKSKSSSASLAERQLGPESQLLGNNLQQEFLSELETATELLRSHAQLVLGNALSHAVQQRMKAMPTQPQTSPKRDDGMLHYLTEAAAESVYVTKDSLAALVRSYYSHLQDISSKLEQDLSDVNQETDERQDCFSQLSRTLMRELEKWGRNPVSAEFQHRVELNKNKVLDQIDLSQELMNEELRRRKVALDQTVERIKTELMEAEESFVWELASLARVSVHSPDIPSGEEDNIGEPSTPTLDLLAMNPALDPALNPSLTPSFVPPKRKSRPKKKRDREPHLS
ncbi:ellis-van Creveld syndrome protein isoform X2 [Austrofundulus limnaeus]|uniref:Ellis-van Creveld syndrome protein isoform X2 n=1 Tax=Austrofundulus limnaeus TaxID=52670 RepID=A0A2I4BBG9_AUSLI|nr:PREDICTED: ellis-van Creveld syndrome protein isoform X2 [Austrofundulus limnaeus]